MLLPFFIQKTLFHTIVENFVNIYVINKKNIHIYTISLSIPLGELG